MRKTLLICALLAMSTCAWAQNMYDALTFSESNHYGTARSIALGNAMTALGGDLGSVTLNPAGSAVSSFSQFTITPGISISAINSSYASVAGEAFGAYDKTVKSRDNMPNIGVICNFDTYRTYGLKKLSVGIVSNSTNNYFSNFGITGTNERSTMLGAMASAATAGGWHDYELDDADSYWSTSLNPPSWNAIAGYKANMIATFDQDGKEYIGSTESLYDDGSISLSGPLYQTARRSVIGTRNDIVFNLGLNFNDNFFLGLNLGMPVATYSLAESFNEKSVNSNDFLINYGSVSTCFEEAQYNYNYVADMDGIYAKVGFIWLPVQGLRLGAAIQTPTLMTISEKWYVDAASWYTDSYYDRNASTPTSEYKYYLRTPYEANFGLAYTYSNLALVSLGWDLTDYRSMRFRDLDDYYYDMDSFRDVNEDIRNYCGVVNTIRAGVEVRPLDIFAARLGFTYKDCPEFYQENGNKIRYSDKTFSYSGGLGYSSRGSFFADVALRLTKFADSSYYPYDDYLTDTASAEIVNTRKMADFVLTLGWRF